MARNGKRLGFLPNWRIFSYIIVLFNLIMLIWVIAGIASGSGTPSDCGGLDAQTCNDAQNVGTGIAVVALVIIWAVVDVILGILWLVTNRKRTRDCPACGRDVKKGLFVCRNCGYDFRAALPGYQGTAAPHHPTPQQGYPAATPQFRPGPAPRAEA